jgi:cytosol alanyl aminopeptidase
LPTSVEARLTIDPAADTFRGAIDITGTLASRASRIWLHAQGLTIHSAVAVAGDERVALTAAVVGDDLLSLVPAAPLPAGAWVLSLQYEGRYVTDSTVGAYLQSEAGRRYVATKLEPVHARRVFPFFDEPDLKVPWRLTLDVPADLVAVANTPITSEEPTGATHKRVAFAPTKALPSYLLAFAVGPYDVVDAGKSRSGVPIRILTFAGAAPQAAWAARTSAKIVDVLEEWFGTPYPYEKLDMISTHAPGAMENAGLITYNQAYILHDPKEISQAERLAWLQVAGHEVAHHWFGNLVTPSWWDDLWLKEGFANWMELKVVAALERKLAAYFPGALGAELELVALRERALTSDQLASARRVHQPIAEGGDILTAFDSITYNKGASVIAMFERYVGADVFQRGVRDYLAAHRFGNATAADFLAAIGATASEDLIPAFSSFLDQVGAPLVSGEVRCPDSGVPQLHLTQQPYHLPTAAPPAASASPARWRIPVCAAYDRDGKRAVACATVANPAHVLPLPATACPRWVMLNATGRGYYRSLTSPAAVAALRELGWKHLTPAERLVVFNDVSALATSGHLEVGLAMSLVPRLLAEKHRFAAVALTARVRSTGELLPPAQQREYDAWIVETFGPMARSLGWMPRRGESLDTERLRRLLLAQVVWAGEPQLRKTAVDLASSWRALPSSVRSLVLGVAADASPAVFEQLLAAVVVEKDPAARQDLLLGLGAVGDEPRLRRALALLFDKSLPIGETMALLLGRSAMHRDVIADYFRQHHEPLLARLPGEGRTAQYAVVFARLCDAARRDEIAAYVRARFAAMTDGKRYVAQSLEHLDQCIAVRASRGPSASAWLSGRKVRRGVASRTGLR